MGTAAQLLAMMGIFDIVGTTASGWLTDRYSSRHLLFSYYTLRGVSLLFLPLTLQDGAGALAWFAVFYGLDWIATVPPTVRLTSEAFGRENTGVIYGWIGASHQLGASLAAVGAGTIRSVLGDYSVAFWLGGTAVPRCRPLVPHDRPPNVRPRPGTARHGVNPSAFSQEFVEADLQVGPGPVFVDRRPSGRARAVCS